MVALGYGVAHLAGDQSGSHRHIASCERLAQTHYVGDNIRVFAGEEFACAPKAGSYLVKDQQYSVEVAKLADPPQVLGRVEAHAPSALYDGLDDDSG